MDKDELLMLADKLVWTAHNAARKIEIERMRGAGYYHAEVDWLLALDEAMMGFIHVLRTKDNGLPNTRVDYDTLVEKYAEISRQNRALAAAEDAAYLASRPSPSGNSHEL